MEADTHMLGEHVIDTEGHRIGKVIQFAVEPHTYRAEWLVLKTSLFGRPRLVPIDGAVEQGDTIRVPFTKETVLDAPVPTVPTTPVVSECTALETYYRPAA